MPDATDPTRAAAERLMADESLGGDLTDDGFGPLLTWGLAALRTFAARTPDPAAVGRYGEVVRGVLAAAVTAAETGKVAAPANLLAFLPDPSAAAPLAQLRLGDDPDENAARLASALRLLLEAAPAPVPLMKSTPAPAAKPRPAPKAAGKRRRRKR